MKIYELINLLSEFNHHAEVELLAPDFCRYKMGDGAESLFKENTVTFGLFRVEENGRPPLSRECYRDDFSGEADDELDITGE